MRDIGTKEATWNQEGEVEAREAQSFSFNENLNCKESKWVKNRKLRSRPAQFLTYARPHSMVTELEHQRAANICTCYTLPAHTPLHHFPQLRGVPITTDNASGATCSKTMRQKGVRGSGDASLLHCICANVM